MTHFTNFSCDTKIEITHWPGTKKNDKKGGLESQKYFTDYPFGLIFGQDFWPIQWGSHDSSREDFLANFSKFQRKKCKIWDEFSGLMSSCTDEFARILWFFRYNIFKFILLPLVATFSPIVSKIPRASKSGLTPPKHHDSFQQNHLVICLFKPRVEKMTKSWENISFSGSRFLSKNVHLLVNLAS